MKLTALLILAAACVGPSSPDLDVINGPPIAGEENQGSTLLGSLDSFTRMTSPGTTRSDRYWVSGAATFAGSGSVAVTAANGVLHATVGTRTISGDDPALVGLRFTGNDGSQIQIQNVYPANADDPIRYDIVYRPSPATSTWTNPCADDHGNPEPADVISGHLTATTRDHIAVAGDMTFSCMSGVAYKCHRWGYSDPGSTTLPTWDLFDACLKLANANYCHTDQSFTRDGTAVSFADKYGIRASYPANWTPWELSTWPPPRSQYYVEAAWRPRNTPICLAKARWQSLPPDPCGPSLPDPRTHPGAKYCEDIGTDALANDSTVLIIGMSLYNDLKLQTWATPGGDLVSTIDGYHDGRVDVPPLPGMSYVGPSGVVLRDFTTEMNPADYVPVFRYCMASAPQRCVVTTASTRPVSHDLQPSTLPEGQIKRRKGPGTTALVLYSNATTGDYVTALASPGTGYGSLGTIGYVLN